MTHSHHAPRAAPPAEGYVKVKHISDPTAIFSHGDKTATPEANGEAKSHGFWPVSATR